MSSVLRNNETINEYCGEIFRSAFKTFEYFCSFCGMKFSSGIEFERHAIHHFLDVEEESAIELSDRSDTEDSSIDENEIDKSTLELSTTYDFEYAGAMTEKNLDNQVQDEPTDTVINGTIEFNNGKVTCNCCNEIFACNGLRDQHIYKLSPAYSKCRKCPAYFSDRMSRLQHSILHSFPEARQFNCTHCGRVFDSKESLIAHMEQNQPQKDLPAKIKPILPALSSLSYECNICKKTFTTKLMLDKHLPTHKISGTNCSICDKHFKSIQHLKSHMISHSDEKLYQCNQCNKTYKYRNSLFAHRAIHYRKMVMCHECGKLYASNAILNTHIREVHKRLKNFICEYCDEAFVKRSRLKDHLYAKHTFDRPYVCTLCNKTFTSSRYLSMHKIIHSDRTFQCRYCDRNFNHMKNRRTHEKRKHLHFID